MVLERASSTIRRRMLLRRRLSGSLAGMATFEAQLSAGQENRVCGANHARRNATKAVCDECCTQAHGDGFWKVETRCIVFRVVTRSDRLCFWRGAAVFVPVRLWAAADDSCPLMRQARMWKRACTRLPCGVFFLDAFGALWSVLFARFCLFFVVPCSVLFACLLESVGPWNIRLDRLTRNRPLPLACAR